MLISPETARFVAEHRSDDVRELALKAKRADGLDLPFALDQIAGWQTARHKLPDWAACEQIIYPPHLSMEQCSSQFTARYKAEIARRIVIDDGPAALPAAPPVTLPITLPDAPAVQPIHGLFVDLTGGFGVDCSYLAREFTHAVYVERQPHLCELAEHNMRALGLSHVTVVNGDAETMLDDGALAAPPQHAESSSMPPASASDSRPASLAIPAASLIFIDPARRDAHGGRTVAIEDCTPNVLALRDRLLAAAPHVMIKLSPMLDWRKAVADFRGAVAEVHIVATGNECKELLLVLSRDRAAQVRVYCVNDSDRLDADYDLSSGRFVRTGGPDKPTVSRRVPQPIAYLYEPNVAMMKAGCFALIEDRYHVAQIGPNSHLFVSDGDRPVADFPGRTFAVDAITTLGKRDVKSALAGVTRANVAVRNFPLTVAQLRKKLRLSDGGNVYLFATTLAGAKHVLIRCHKP